MRVLRYVWPALAAALLLPLAGCGGKDKPVKVEGVVTLDGNPLKGALVTFLPDEGGSGRVAIATTAADGSFSLNTPNDGEGALPGDYRVTIIYVPPDEAQADAAQPQANAKMTGPEGMKMMGKMGAAGEARRQAMEKGPVPMGYTNYIQTPLKQKVPAGGKVALQLRSDFVAAIQLEKPAAKVGGPGMMPGAGMKMKAGDATAKEKAPEKGPPPKSGPAEKASPPKEKENKP